MERRRLFFPGIPGAYGAYVIARRSLGFSGLWMLMRWRSAHGVAVSGAPLNTRGKKGRKLEEQLTDIVAATACGAVALVARTVDIRATPGELA